MALNVPNFFAFQLPNFLAYNNFQEGFQIKASMFFYTLKYRSYKALIIK